MFLPNLNILLILTDKYLKLQINNNNNNNNDPYKILADLGFNYELIKTFLIFEERKNINKKGRVQ